MKYVCCFDQPRNAVFDLLHPKQYLHDCALHAFHCLMNDSTFKVDSKVFLMVELLARLNLLDVDSPKELVDEVMRNLNCSAGYAVDTVTSILQLLGFEHHYDARVNCPAIKASQSVQSNWVELPDGWEIDDLRAIIVCHQFHYTLLQFKESKWGWYEWSQAIVPDFTSAKEMRTTLESKGDIKGLIFVKTIDQAQMLKAAVQLSTMTTRAFGILGSIILPMKYGDDNDADDGDDDEDDVEMATPDDTTQSTAITNSSKKRTVRKQLTGVFRCQFTLLTIFHFIITMIMILFMCIISSQRHRPH